MSDVRQGLRVPRHADAIGIAGGVLSVIGVLAAVVGANLISTGHGLLVTGLILWVSGKEIHRSMFGG